MNLELVRQYFGTRAWRWRSGYAHLTKPDVSAKFRRASPLDNLREAGEALPAPLEEMALHYSKNKPFPRKKMKGEGSCQFTWTFITIFPA